MKQYNEQLMDKITSILNTHGERRPGAKWTYWYTDDKVEEKRAIYGPLVDILPLSEVSTGTLKRALREYLKFNPAGDDEIYQLYQELNEL